MNGSFLSLSRIGDHWDVVTGWTATGGFGLRFGRLAGWQVGRDGGRREDVLLVMQEWFGCTKHEGGWVVCGYGKAWVACTRGFFNHGRVRNSICFLIWTSVRGAG